MLIYAFLFISLYFTILFNKTPLKNYPIFSSINIQTEKKLCSQPLGPFKELLCLFPLFHSYIALLLMSFLYLAHVSPSCRHAIPTLIALTFIRAVYFRIYVNIHMYTLSFGRDVLHLHIRKHTPRVSH